MKPASSRIASWLLATATAVVATVTQGAPASAAGSPDRPNIVLIVADDLGYGDLGCYGSKGIHTPVLDRMASEGLRFTQFYATAMCSPARASLMTGLHTGNTRNDVNGRPCMAAGDRTMGHVLGEAGYDTACFGKWEGGRAPDLGFARFFGYEGNMAAHRYYPQKMTSGTDAVTIPENADGKHGAYSHALLMKETLAFLGETRERPFLLYLPFTLPHAELVAEEEDIAPYRGKFPEVPYPGSKLYPPTGQPNATYAAMVSRLDKDVGRILRTLEERGLRENTVVIFTSDNGPAPGVGRDIAVLNSSGGLRGAKFGLYEGGIRVPCIVWWPGRVPARVSETPAAIYDLLPTFAELARTPPGKTDGASLTSEFFGKGDVQRDYLYWQTAGGKKWAIRQGAWKLVAETKRAELFNLANDPAEKNDLASQEPARVAAMTEIATRLVATSPAAKGVKDGKDASKDAE